MYVHVHVARHVLMITVTAMCCDCVYVLTKCCQIRPNRGQLQCHEDPHHNLIVRSYDQAALSPVDVAILVQMIVAVSRAAAACTNNIYTTNYMHNIPNKNKNNQYVIG